jgi:hypothetical protein
MQIHRFRLAKLTLGMSAIILVALAGWSRNTAAFNPQPDPPGFGLVTLVPGQDLRINVVCSEHGAGRLPPGPCVGVLMFHDADGNTLSEQRVVLRPGQATSFELNLGRDGGSPIGINPCWIPGPDNTGFAIPSAEVFNTETGHTMLYLNPVVARLRELDTARAR